MACDEPGPLHEIRRPDWLRSKPQVRRSTRAGLLRVVDEEALRVARRLLTDDLDRVLVGADRTVGAQAIEDASNRVGWLGDECRIVLEARIRHVIRDPNREVVL